MSNLYIFSKSEIPKSESNIDFNPFFIDGKIYKVVYLKQDKSAPYYIENKHGHVMRLSAENLNEYFSLKSEYRNRKINDLLK